MKRLQKAAILLDLIKKMRKKEGWCGETHIQKVVYFFETLFCSDLDNGFILYKHGPFSFDLRDELTALRADGLAEIEINPAPYGPSFEVTANGEEIIKSFPKTFEKYGDKIDFIADYFADKKVVQLERLGTALYVSQNHQGLSMDKQAEKLNELKPHISIKDAKKALNEVKIILSKVEEV